MSWAPIPKPPGQRSLRSQLDLDSLDFMAYVERLSERTGAP